LGRWILRLSAFKLKATHTRGSETVVADALSRRFEGPPPEDTESICPTMLNTLPLVYSSLQDHQRDDPFCRDVREAVENKEKRANNFQIYNQLLCYFPRGAKRRRWVIPISLKGMVLRYFHEGIFAGHLGAWKTFGKVSSNFWWPDMRNDVFKYVQRCELCQRAKPAQNTRLGLHSAQPSSYPLEKLFIDFLGPLVRSKTGNIAVLVIVDSFSKFVALYPVRKIDFQVVMECLERRSFRHMAPPNA